MVAQMAVRGGSSTALSAPAGWTQIRRDSDATGQITEGLYYHVVTGSEPASYSWTFTAGNDAAGGIADYTGVNAANPIDASGGQANASSTSVTAPSVDIPAGNNNDRLLALFAIPNGAAMILPGALTGRWNFRATGYGIAAAMGDTATPGGATADYVAVQNISTVNIGAQIALRPVASPGSGPLVIVSPAGGSTASGSVTVSVTSTLSLNDDWWNTLAVDGMSTGLNDAGHYQQIVWNSATVPNGSHTLTVTAHQYSTGTVTATASVSIIVSNGLPTTSALRVDLDPTAHAKYGLYYPATYAIGIPGGSSGLTAQYRYDTASAWSPLPTKTASDFFNGIPAARFAYASNTAYVSVPFSLSSDTIYLRVINSAQQPVTVSYQGISKYYDNRKAAVTIGFDDITDGYLPDDVQAISLTAAKNLRVTAAVETAYMSSGSWSTVQGWVDAGFTEAAAHTRTHPCTDAQYQVLGYTSEVVGSRDDLLSNLELPNPFIPTFVEPCGFSDAELLGTIAAAGYLVNRSANSGDENFGAWDPNGFYDANLTAEPECPVYTSYPNPGGTAALLSSWNSMFDSVYASGGIYQLVDHPWAKCWSTGGYLDQHASYIANRKDVWYATLGELYLYHYLQERGKVTVTAQ